MGPGPRRGGWGLFVCLLPQGGDGGASHWTREIIHADGWADAPPHFLFGLAEKKTGRARSKRKERFWPQLCTCVQSCCTGVCVSVPAPILPGLRARYGLLRGRYCRPVAEGAEGVGVVIALICFSFRCRWLSRTGAGKAPGRPVGAVINRPISSCALPGRGTAKAAELRSAAFVFVFF